MRELANRFTIKFGDVYVEEGQRYVVVSIIHKDETTTIVGLNRHGTSCVATEFMTLTDNQVVIIEQPTSTE